MQYWIHEGGEYILPDAHAEYYWDPWHNEFIQSECPRFNNLGCEYDSCDYRETSYCPRLLQEWQETTEDAFFEFYFEGIETGQYFDYDDALSVYENFSEFCDEDSAKRYIEWRRKQDINARNRKFWVHEDRKGSTAFLQC